MWETTTSKPLVSVSIAFAKKRADSASVTIPSGIEKFPVKTTLSSIPVKKASAVNVKFASGIFAVIPKLALKDSSCFNCGIPKAPAIWLSLENVPTSYGTPEIKLVLIVLKFNWAKDGALKPVLAAALKLTLSLNLTIPANSSWK